jgi:two-component system sensor histidine kinase LytS
MIDPALKSVLIPPFTLQPLVENAIRHAFPKMKYGKVMVSAYIKNGKMILITEDNGKGIPPHLLRLIGKETVQSDEGTGTALWNIKKRIEELYGQEGSFEIICTQDFGTKVFITLPLSCEPLGELG